MITRSIRRRVADWALRAVPVITALVFGASQASASFVEAGTTHPYSGTPGGASAIIAFAVYNLSPGSGTDPYGIGANTSAITFINNGVSEGNQYLYLYAVQNDPAGASLAAAAVGVVTPIPASDLGALPYSFATGVGSIFSTAGPATVNAPAMVGAPAPVIAGPTGVSANPAYSPGTGLGATFSALLVAGAEANLFGYTSMSAPVSVGSGVVGFFNGFTPTTAVGTALAGDVIPEPSTIVMAALAVPAGLIYVVRRRRVKTA
jgi:hypothetical protein